MFGLCRSRQEKAKTAAQDEMVCEIIRFLGRIDKTPLMLAYTKVIYGLAETLDTCAAMKIRDWRTPAIDNADMAVAPMLENRESELRSWLQFHPEFAFSLVAALAMGKGENYAWAIAYG